MAPQLKPATGWKPLPKPRIMPKGNIMILVHTPTPARTESEILPAMSLSRMPATTARPLRNMEEEPTLTTLVMMSLLKWMFFTERCSRLRLEM